MFRWGALSSLVALLLSLSAVSLADSNAGVVSIINDRTLEARVLGGGDAEPDAWPSIVALVQSGVRPLQNRLFCGGTLVASQWVLTAAHCLHNQSNLPMEISGLRVVGGITNLQTDTAVQEVEITSIIIHPGYDPYQELPPNDIALLELQSPIDAEAATLFAGEMESASDALAWVAGWGATSYQNNLPGDYAAALQDAAVPLVSTTDCNSPESYDGLITSTHLCAGYVDGQVDACAGDSGGPLFFIEGNVRYQIGITSFGNGCGLPLFYGIYTSVSHFIPWLANYIDVPYQSPELIASRQNAVASETSASDTEVVQQSDTRAYAGSMGFVMVLLLLARVLLTASATTSVRSESDRS